jgi:dipeptidyl aminopeptidase/acylaminoacyl peptidase
MTLDEFLDALLTLPRPIGERVSPDGTWIAWSFLGTSAGADVYVAPTDGSAPPVRLTATGEETMVVSWAADSRTLVVGEDHDGDERVRLYAIDREAPDQLRPLTEANPGYFLYGGRLSPDRRTLYYAANRDDVTGAEIATHLLYRHDLATGARTVLARPLKPNAYAPFPNESGTRLLYARKDRHPGGRQVWMVDVDGGNDREILNAGDERKVQAGWFPHDDRILVVAETATHKRLGVWAPGSSGDALTWLIDDPGFTLEGAFMPHHSARIVAIETRAARSRAWLVDPASGARSEFATLPGAALPGATILPLAPVGEGAAGGWVASIAGSTRPRDLVALGGGAEPRSLTGLWTRTRLAPADFAPAEDLRWTAPDGLEIQGWFYRPAQDSQQARGTVVVVHGGPTAHSEDRLDIQIQYLVRAGFNVLDPNYRGSTGFGLAFREAIKSCYWGGAEQEDIAAGVRHLIARGLASPGKVGITGTSYGGYSSWCAITRYPPDLIAAAAPICGMTDLVVDYETTRPDLRPYSEEMLGGSPASAAERYRERSPIHFVSAIKGRLLIVQGMRDPNVTPENVRAVREALDAADVPHELLAFADEGHGIMKPANRKQLYRRLASFFAAAFA